MNDEKKDNKHVHERNIMIIQTISMTGARANFAENLDAASNGEVIVIQRRGKPDTAIVSADLLEDFLASTNPRIIKKINAVRAETESLSFDEVFSGIL